MWYMHVDLQAPNDDESHVETLTTVHHVQILEIDANLLWYNTAEHPHWDRCGDRMNALLHGVHDPSM